MAQITIEEVYRGEKYGVMGQVVKDLFEHGLDGEDLQTTIELLIIKHTLIVAERMKKEGDFVSELTDVKSPSCYEEGK
jgi:hypothetical protein